MKTLVKKLYRSLSGQDLLKRKAIPGLVFPHFFFRILRQEVRKLPI